MADAARLLSRIWGTDKENGPLVSSELLRALSYSENFVAGARRDGRLLGVSVGFLSLKDAGLTLHSHVSGVLPGSQSQNAGFALKQFQRAWALERKISQITWTFDPLVRRNAYFNITKLGAEVNALHRNFYGPMSDGINAGDESDRCLVAWNAESPRVLRASVGLPDHMDVEQLRMSGAVVVLAEGRDDSPQRSHDEGEVRLCWIPQDISKLRASAPTVARLWRLALREAMTAAFRDGLAAVGFSRTGWYVFGVPK